MKKKKSQGEIFGVALLFVILIIGFVIFSRFKAVTAQSKPDEIKSLRHEVLAANIIDTVLEMSTGCPVSKNKDSVKDLILYCGLQGFGNEDPPIACSDREVLACRHAVFVMNETLNSVFNQSVIGKIPYELTLEVPQNKIFQLNNVTLTNFGNFTSRGKPINLTKSTIFRFFSNRASSDKFVLPTAQGDIIFSFFLYYN